jgi:predicted RNase H-like nuclease (RuvC/YqgF family)
MSDLELTMMRRVGELNKENARLKAEVENSKRINTELLALSNRQASDIRRLTKELENTDCMFAMASAFARDWNAAKEGSLP